jgi:hypothetical protein
MRTKVRLKRMTQWLNSVCVLALLLPVAGCGPTVQPDSPAEATREDSQTRTRPPAGAETRYDLAKDEERGGHTLAKHVGRIDDELRKRLERERNISAASTWTSREAAEETVGAALRQKREQIERWEARGYRRPNLALHFDARRVIGRSMRHGDAISSPCTRAVIVLKADGAYSYYVLTTYPEDRR